MGDSGEQIGDSGLEVHKRSRKFFVDFFFLMSRLTRCCNNPIVR